MNRNRQFIKGNKYGHSSRDTKSVFWHRIGHTRKIISHLFRKDPPSFYDTCNTRTTVASIISECQKCTHGRQKLNVTDSLEKAFSISEKDNIIRFN